METIGEILKNAREKKGLTIETLEKKTHIVSRYIKALEDDEFDKLPGEIYIKGFIKNLSDKLSLDSKLVLERYSLQINEGKFEQDLSKNEKNAKSLKKEAKTKKIENVNNINNKENINENKDSSSEEAEIEIRKVAISRINEEFNKSKSKIRSNISNPESDLLTATRRDLDRLKNSRKRIPIVTIIVILAVLVVIAVVIVLFFNRNDNISSRKNNNGGNESVGKDVVNSKVTQNVKTGDIINFKPMGISADIRFNSIGNVINVNINGQDLSLSKSSPIILDLSGNGINDFKINVLEIYDNLATVEMERLEENQMINAGNGDSDINDIGSNIQNQPLSIPNLQVIDGETYIEQNIEKSNINIDITAKGFVYLRYFIDSGAPATQNLLSGRTVSLEASDVIMFTIGNAGEVTVRVNGIIVKVGEAGETVNKTIKWIRNLNDSTKYNLIMSDTR